MSLSHPSPMLCSFLTVFIFEVKAFYIILIAIAMGIVSYLIGEKKRKKKMMEEEEVIR